MDIKDALIITGLGIGVVFSGLILTDLLIASFSFFPAVVQRFKKRRSAKKEGEVQLITKGSKEVDPDVVAVITAVLEVESRMRQALVEKF
jgi:Na+-transporting methylmalonyl-CoA/oxaloacetate decarboxylase gamma subunit